MSDEIHPTKEQTGGDLHPAVHGNGHDSRHENGVNGREPSTSPPGGDGELELLKQFVRDEIEKNRRYSRWFSPVGGALAMLMVFYLCLLGFQIKTFILDPNVLAVATKNILVDTIQDRMDPLERDLINRAPENSAYLVSELHDVIPALGHGARRELDTIFHALTHSSAVEEQTRQFARENFRQFRQETSGAPYDQLAKAYVERAYAAFLAEFDRELRKDLGGSGLDSVAQATLDGIVHGEALIADLATKNRFRMTREEALARRMLVTWLVYLEEHFGKYRPNTGEHHAAE